MDFSPCATSATVRIAARGAAEAMRAVYAPYVETPVTFDTVAPSRAEFAARMADAMAAYPCLVLEQDGRVVGFAYAHAQAGCGFQRCWVQSHAGWKAGSWHDVTWYVKELAPFDDDPADPVPFSELARTRPDFVQQVLDEANAALEANVPTDCA